MKLSQEQIRRECEEIFISNYFGDSEVYQEWVCFAENWFADNASDYFKDGFKGFNQRTTDEIILDFHLNDGLIDKLTEKQVDEFISKL